MQILGYLVLVFGVIGILLGLVGLMLPQARRKGFSLSLPKLRLPGKGDNEDVDQLIAELEQSGFRNSPFEAKPPVPTMTKPATAASKGPGGASSAAGGSPDRLGLTLPGARSTSASQDDDEMGTFLPRSGYDDEEEEELDPVVAELLAEVQAAQDAAALEAEAFAEVEEEAEGDSYEAFVQHAKDEPEQEPAVVAVAAPGAADELDAGLLDLFAETTYESKTSEALRDAVPEVDIQDLLNQAREVRFLLRDPKARARNRVA